MNIGDTAPDFSLPDLEGRVHQLRDYRGRIVLANFWSCECPHAVRTDALLVASTAAWGEGVVLLPIACNANESLAALKAAATRQSLPLVLVDNQQRVADLFEALTTPHVFVLDAQGILRYEGAVDDVNFGRRQPQRFFLQEVVQQLLDGSVPSISRTQPYGCAIVRHALE